MPRLPASEGMVRTPPVRKPAPSSEVTAVVGLAAAGR
jgi:hypothetical protein